MGWGLTVGPGVDRVCSANSKEDIMATAAVILAAVVVLVFGMVPVILGRILSNSFIHFTNYSTQFTIDDGLQKGEIPPGFMERPFQRFTVSTEDGLTLSGWALKGRVAKTVIFIHGVSWTRYGMVKYMWTFLERGWNVVAFDHRAHGESQGTLKTFGVREKHDLVAVIRWARQQFPQAEVLGLFGESMGAATMLQAAPLVGDVDFMVADSSFSDLRVLAITHLRKLHIPGVLVPSILWWANRFTYRRADFRLEDASPIRAIQGLRIPVVFFHGTADKMSPCHMSADLQRAVDPQTHTEVWLQEGAEHSTSIMVDRATYEARLWKFIDSVTQRERRELVSA